MLPWERHERCLSLRKISFFFISERVRLLDAKVFEHEISWAHLCIYSPSPWKAKWQILSLSPQSSRISDALKQQWSKSLPFIFCREPNIAVQAGHCPFHFVLCVTSQGCPGAHPACYFARIAPTQDLSSAGQLHACGVLINQIHSEMKLPEC